MYKYSLGGIVMHLNNNKYAVGILTLMGYDFKETENAYYFYSSDGKIISFVPKKSYEVPMAQAWLENSVRTVYNNWLIGKGESLVESGLSDIYSEMYEKVDKSSQEYKTALERGLIFKLEDEKTFFGAMQEVAA